MVRGVYSNNPEEVFLATQKFRKLLSIGESVGLRGRDGGERRAFLFFPSAAARQPNNSNAPFSLIDRLAVAHTPPPPFL